MTVENLIEKAKEAGFSYAVNLDVATIHLMSEVRDMCEANTCGMYGKCWSCPPGCGDLEECRKKVERYSRGIIVQTVGKLEDSMDWEGIMEAEASHKEHFTAFIDMVHKEIEEYLPLGAGACTRCKKCTYPDEPCRFPDKAISSMESYGMLVNQICTDNQLAYNYGPQAIAYTSCFLFNE